MIISPFTPLFFIHRKTDGRESEYVQTFAPSDRILLEIIGGHEVYDVKARIFDECEGKEIQQIQFNRWNINSTATLAFSVISLNPGKYSVSVDGFGKSKPFLVTDNARVLDKTTLIQYSMKDNRQRNDAVFFIDGMQYFFDFRVPGGFKDSNWQFGVESEQFVTQYSDIVQLYGLESTQKIFTLGGSAGVPVWFGEMLNRILVCTHVYFDGEKYSRKESNAPELTTQLEGVNSFVFTQSLQRSVNLDPVLEERLHAVLRRIDGVEDYRLIDTTLNRMI